MRMEHYLPKRGDVVWIYLRAAEGSFLPSGRPAVVLSPESYNRRVGLAIFCPVSDDVKGYPFEVAIPAGLPASGVILADQLESVDWQSGVVELICTLPAETVEAVLRKAATLLEIPDRP